jgi:hypothetical protein
MRAPIAHPLTRFFLTFLLSFWFAFLIVWARECP